MKRSEVYHGVRKSSAHNCGIDDIVMDESERPQVIFEPNITFQ